MWEEQSLPSTNDTPPSKTCYKCQHINKDLKQGEQIWTCPQCNTTHHRDINAAKNILQEGLKEQNNT